MAGSFWLYLFLRLLSRNTPATSVLALPPFYILHFDFYILTLNQLNMYHRYTAAAPAFLFLGFWLTFSSLTAQCPLTVDAGPNKFVCSTGSTVDLDGSIGGAYLGFRWTPATGLANPTTLTPTATVNGTVTYTLSAAAEDPAAPNLVTNPGFESGNTGFTSGYTYNPTPINPGTYVLTTSPALVLAQFPPCDDHTFGNGTGFMMLCNGNGGPSTQVWCQTIPVQANNWYVLSAWVLASPISPPVFQFKVNGANVGTPRSRLFGREQDVIRRASKGA